MLLLSLKETFLKVNSLLSYLLVWLDAFWFHLYERGQVIASLSDYCPERHLLCCLHNTRATCWFWQLDTFISCSVSPQFPQIKEATQPYLNIHIGQGIIDTLAFAKSPIHIFIYPAFLFCFCRFGKQRKGEDQIERRSSSKSKTGEAPEEETLQMKIERERFVGCRDGGKKAKQVHFLGIHTNYVTLFYSSLISYLDILRNVINYY